MTNSLPRSAREAKASGSALYFTGVPCSRGHLAERVAASRGCVSCQAHASAKYRVKNHAAVIEREKGKRARRRDDIIAYARERYRTNRDKVRLATDKWRQANKDKDAAKTARRKAALLQACPAWVDHTQIEAFYAQARDLTEKTGVLHEVDHIHPLQGETFCGLHVPWNLQILTKSENSRKKNRLLDAALSEGKP